MGIRTTLIAIDMAPMIQNAFPGAVWNLTISAKIKPPRLPKLPTIPDMTPCMAIIRL